MKERYLEEAILEIVGRIGSMLSIMTDLTDQVIMSEDRIRKLKKRLDEQEKRIRELENVY